ncbi:uncharacterized protein At4g04775-like [Medicago truncatula]|uniref:uncharacterized protein At4g04775-like n=1 Tax=Medicago truncatula TaxID=3880 RepID=UPI0002363FFE|nr:uncharacterized protein At4g04775-like [Medicago truncatula]
MSPICGCEKVMKMWISNTDENPKRKFWRCRFSRMAEYSCELFIWDDELDKILKHSEKYYGPGCSSGLKSEAGCNNGVMTMEFLREFGKDFGKEFAKEFGKEYGKEHGKENVQRSMRNRK